MDLGYDPELSDDELNALFTHANDDGAPLYADGTMGPRPMGKARRTSFGLDRTIPLPTSNAVIDSKPRTVGGAPDMTTATESRTSEATDWEYEPVPFKEFCESGKHMKLLPANWKQGDEGALSDRQYQDCYAIVGDNPKRMFDPKYRRFTFAALLWGKGSGKDFICSVIQAYVVYILLCMRNPRAFFGFAVGESCDILNVGKKGKQAKHVYFKKFVARIKNWVWIKERYNIVEENRRIHFAGKDKPTCKIGGDFVEFMDKDVRAYSETSNPEGFEGYNIIFYLCDEISGWVSPAERAVAEKMLGVLRSSQHSRNTRSLCGLGAAISYPRQDDDLMFTFKKEAQQPNSTTYWSEGYPWQVKPKRLYDGEFFDFNMGSKDSPEIVQIPVELRDEFDKNPEDSKGKYLLRPPAVAGQYFEHLERIDAIIKPELKPLFKVETDYIESKDGKGNRIFYVRKVIVGIERPPQRDVDYVIWLDAGDTTCDASLSVGHLETAVVEEANQRRDVQVVVLDQTIVWEPDQKLSRIVDIDSMTTCCLTMQRYITLAAAWWDQWNSGTGVYNLRNAGILCDRYNLRGSDYDFFKSMIYTGRFVAPNVPEVNKGIGQVKHLSRTRTGNVEPGSKFHKKDIADTWCGIVTLLQGALLTKSFRAGRLPTSITIGSGLTRKSQGISATGYSQGMVSKLNPFGGLMNQMGKSLVAADPTDMFRGLQGARATPFGRVTRSKPSPGTQPGTRRLPTGRRL
jgi:hypothetical protein